MYYYYYITLRCTFYYKIYMHVIISLLNNFYFWQLKIWSAAWWLRSDRRQKWPNSFLFTTRIRFFFISVNSTNLVKSDSDLGHFHVLLHQIQVWCFANFTSPYFNICHNSALDGSQSKGLTYRRFFGHSVNMEDGSEVSQWRDGELLFS